MRKLLLLAAAASAFAAAAAVAPAAPPPSLPDGPDLSAMALTTSDFGGGTVDQERYLTEEGALAAYERDLELRGRLVFASNQVVLFTTATRAQNEIAPLRRALNTRAGRAAFARALRAELAGLRPSALVVSRPAGIRAGSYAFRVGVRVNTRVGRLHVVLAFVRVDRAIGAILILARPRQTVPTTQVVRLAQVQAARFRAGFRITSVAAPTLTGEARVGQTLTAATGRWTGGPTELTYQWRRCDAVGANCVDIPGATAATYVVQTTDAAATVRVRVQARNPLSLLSVESVQSGVVAP